MFESTSKMIIRFCPQDFHVSPNEFFQCLNKHKQKFVLNWFFLFFFQCGFGNVWAWASHTEGGETLRKRAN